MTQQRMLIGNDDLGYFLVVWWDAIQYGLVEKYAC